MNLIESIQSVINIIKTVGLIAVMISPVSCKAQNTNAQVDTGSENHASVVYQNPVMAHDFPDPAVLKAPDGWIYAYATQSPSDNGMINIQVAKSRDLINWQRVGDALPVKPGWADQTQSFWAPHVLYDSTRKTYYMYFSSNRNNQDGHCIGVATAQHPEGPFKDNGSPLMCGDGFVNIDPMAFDDPQSGEKLLYWGSGFQPIKVLELADDRTHFKDGSSSQNLVAPGTREPYDNLVEGAWIHYKNGYYYLFYSGDNCCGDQAHYAVMVARSKHAKGPYKRLGETGDAGSSVILKKSDTWIAPGHNSIITDDNGQDWILYHAIDPNHHYIQGTHNDRRVLMIDPVRYENGWPVINNGKPSEINTLTPDIN